MKITPSNNRFWFRLVLMGSIVLFAMVMAAVLLQGILRWQFSENLVKQEIRNAIEPTNRMISFNEGMALDLLPRPTITLTGIKITEQKNMRTAISIPKLEFEFDWFDLFNKKPMPSRLVLDSMSAQVFRDTEGKLSIDDLLILRHESNSLPARFKKFQLVNASISVTDQTIQKKFKVEQFNFFIKDHYSKDGRLDFQAKLHTDDYSFDFKGQSKVSRVNDGFLFNNFSFDASTRLLPYGHTNLNFVAQAEYKPQKHAFTIRTFEGHLSLDSPALTLNTAGENWTIYADRADFPMIDFYADLKYSVSKESIDFHGIISKAQLNDTLFKADEIKVATKFSTGSRTVSLQSASPLSFDLSSNVYTLDPMKIRGNHLTLGKDKNIQGELTGHLTGILEKNYRFTSEGIVDDSNMIFELNYLKEKLKSYQFALSMERLDAVPIEPKSEEEITTAFFDSERPFDLSFLDDKKISGRINIQNLTTSKFQIQQLNAQISAKPNEIAIDQINASVYQGKLSGSSKLSLMNNVPNLEINHSIIGVNIQPLLMDLFGYQKITGKGNGRIYLKAAALTPKKMRTTLSGDINLEVRNGALLGINLVETFQKSPNELQNIAKPEQLDATKKTEFSILRGDSHLENGVARNKNLVLNSELINLRGEGKLDLDKDLIDYTMYITASPKLNRFKDVNVPLRITGDIVTPTYSLDYAAMTKGKLTKEAKQKALKDELLKQINGIIKH